MKTKQLIEKLKEYIKALEKRVGNYELSHIELINLRHSICILEGKLELASIEQKREKIIEILAKYYPNFANIEKVADAILALFEQKESVKKKIPKETKIKICAACGSFAHGNPGHDIT